MIAPPTLAAGVVHVWRLSLDAPRDEAFFRGMLSDDERARADRFYTDLLRRRFIIAHGWTRHLLAHYTRIGADALRFAEGEHGKPELVNPGVHGLHFSLSHSQSLGALAVGIDGPVGVDIESWDRRTDHLRLADHCFSDAERAALGRLAGDSSAVVAGFFAAWTRKEAYLKATGLGITRGLKHFDVSLSPNEPARLLADRHDESAHHRWAMTSMVFAEGYSAAVVAPAPLRTVSIFDAVRAAEGRG